MQLLDRQEEVHEQLEDAIFVAAWRKLVAHCPWATAFQDVPFVRTWWRIYQDVYAPLLLIQKDEHQAVTGLIALARHRRDGTLVIAGAEQAEYKCWLAKEDDNGRFILLAAKFLSKRFPKASLRFNFLPAGTPFTALMADRSWAKRTFLRKIPQPLIDIGDGEEARKSLHKKSNRSRVNRLRKQGDLRLEIIDSAVDLAPHLTQIAEHYDLRQGGRNAVMPFRGDQRKWAFLMALMETPELFSASLLMLDRDVLAANLGVRTGGTITVGVFSFSPLYASASPGKLLLRLLSQRLSATDVHTLDLTPGGTWKDRFANRHDEVVELSLLFDKGEALMRRVREQGEASAKKLLSLFGLTPARVREATRSARKIVSGWPTTPIRTSGGPYHCYRLEPEIAFASCSEPAFSRNDISRLLDAAALDHSGQFLAESLTRIENEEHFYAPIKDAPPYGIFWAKRHDEGGLPLPPSVPRELRSAVLVVRDETLRGGDESVNMTINLFKQIAHDTRRLGDDLETLVLVRKGDTVLDLALQRLGCQLHQ